MVVTEAGRMVTVTAAAAAVARSDIMEAKSIRTNNKSRYKKEICTDWEEVLRVIKAGRIWVYLHISVCTVLML